MATKRRVASNDDQLSEFLFGSVRPWWDRHPWLRRGFIVALKAVDRSYARWSKARVSPRRFRKIQERLDREYPPDKFSPSNLIGRDKEFNLLLDSFRLHVLRHPILAKYFGRDELLPAAFLPAGGSRYLVPSLPLHLWRFRPRYLYLMERHYCGHDLRYLAVMFNQALGPGDLFLGKSR